MAKCPFREAQCSAVLPELFCLFTKDASEAFASSEEVEEEEKLERRN